MLNVLKIIGGVLLLLLIAFGPWMMTGYLSSRFLPEPLWIPLTVLALVGGIGGAFHFIRYKANKR